MFRLWRAWNRRQGSRYRAGAIAGGMVLLLVSDGVKAGPVPQVAPLRVSVYTVGRDGVDPRPVCEAFERALASLRLSARRGTKLVPLAQLLERDRRPTPQQERDLSEQLTRAKAMLRSLELEDAVALLSRAIERVERAFDLAAEGAPRRARYLDALALLAQARFLSGATREARELLSRVMTLDSSAHFDPVRDPPAMQRLFRAVRGATSELGSGTLSVRSTPSGASVYVDGRYVGVTPLERTTPLPAGRTLVTLRKLGYLSLTRPATVGTRGRTTVSVILAPLPGDPLAAVRRALAGDGRDLPGAARELAQRLSVDAVVAVEVDTVPGVDGRRGVGEAGRRWSVRLWRPAGDGDGGGSIKGELRALSIVDDARKLVRALFRSPLEGPGKPRRGGLWRRMTSSRLFWPLVGAVAGALVIGAVVGITVGTSRQTSPGRRLVVLSTRVGF